MLTDLKTTLRSSWISLLMMGSILVGASIGHQWPEAFARLRGGLRVLLVPLVLEIFAANIAVILEHGAVFVWVLLGVFLFFVFTFLLGEGVSRLGRLDYPEHALLTMSIAARNAPLMLAVTMAALPGQPLIYAALVIGMLVEFPHLTVLQRVLLAQRQRTGLSPYVSPEHP